MRTPTFLAFEICYDTVYNISNLFRRMRAILGVNVRCLNFSGYKTFLSSRLRQILLITQGGWRAYYHMTPFQLSDWLIWCLCWGWHNKEKRTFKSKIQGSPWEWCVKCGQSIRQQYIIKTNRPVSKWYSLPLLHKMHVLKTTISLSAHKQWIKMVIVYFCPITIGDIGWSHHVRN